MFVGVVIQHAVRMLRIVSSVVFLVVQYFSTLSHKHYEFRKTKLLNTKSVFGFYTSLFSETFVTVERRTQVTLKNVNCSSCKVLVILLRFK